MSNGNAFTKRDLITVLTAVSDKQDDMESKIRDAENRAESAERRLKDAENRANVFNRPVPKPSSNIGYGISKLVVDITCDILKAYLENKVPKENEVPKENKVPKENEVPKENKVGVFGIVGVLGVCAAGAALLMSDKK